MSALTLTKSPRSSVLTLEKSPAHRVTRYPIVGDMVKLDAAAGGWAEVRRTPDEDGSTFVRMDASGYVRRVDMPAGGWHVLVR